MNGIRAIGALSSLVVLSALFAFSCAHEPVPEDYYLDISRVRGGEKPAPAPCIDKAEMGGADIIIDFNCTKTAGTVDPESGTADNLYYLFYWSSGNPSLFTSELSYYDELYYLGYVAHADVASDMKVSVDPGEYRGIIYFWMTAHDGGRESDHSNVVNITVP